MELKGILADHFPTQSPNLYRRISECRTNLFNTAWQKSRPVHGANSRQLYSQHSLKRTLFQISVWNPDWVPNLGCRGLVPDFPFELSQQFLSFASIMDMIMQEDVTITQHTRAFASVNFLVAK
ncbi:hypothetical protein AVEN_188529-1 [Araneus ventricosus]|uniref:Uncharacterized protein n=1 Tax=Araneus ventricosus TaxID=182803 RepID=A0A4Y2NZL5_ARAVE|nr:hypothetical protein AVEN_188529-1 [Araneus ventricosus]